jgi:hypothetical protein
VTLVTLLAQLAVLPEKYLDLGTMDGRRNVTVVREGGLVEQVGNLRRLKSGESRVRPTKRKCLRRQPCQSCL